ncbi:hypothetical protein [uncultured Desulfobacter sp.]|uniref:hypothetical protein n=1 Tax=uncultured Desulfobacter sp. TaxID=240139 RepID=UPI002AAC49AC|nr:hypothetical protein [uncultured Desulfobacter sp.]
MFGKNSEMGKVYGFSFEFYGRYKQAQLFFQVFCSDENIKKKKCSGENEYRSSEPEYKYDDKGALLVNIGR